LELPQIGRAADRPADTPRWTSEPVSGARVARSAPVVAADAPRARSTSAVRARTPHASAVRRADSVQARTPRRPSTPVAVPPQPAATTLTPAREGWSRRGLTEPSGQTRRTTVQSEPTPSGQTRARGAVTHDKTTTTPATPVTAPVPPGQQKKADDPSQTTG
jgi:hypothetical protein